MDYRRAPAIRENCVAVVRREDINVVRAEPGARVGPSGLDVGPLLGVVQGFDQTPSRERALGVVQDVDRLLLHVPRTLSRGDHVAGSSLHGPVAIEDAQVLRDPAAVEIVLLGEGLGLMERVVAVRPEQAVLVLLDDEGRQPLVARAVLAAVLLEGEALTRKPPAPGVVPLRRPASFEARAPSNLRARSG